MKTTKERHLSEFEIQSYLFHQLTNVLGTGYIVRGEVTHGSCRFDLAIFDAHSRKLLCTLETKKRHGNKNSKWSTINQISKYQTATGKPCILVTDKNMYSIVSAVRARLARS